MKIMDQTLMKSGDNIRSTTSEFDIKKERQILVVSFPLYRVPTSSGNQGKSLKKSMHGKIMEFEKNLNIHGKIMEFCENI